MNGQLVYITVATPHGDSEQFLLSELLMLKQLGVRLMIVPRSPKRLTVHGEAASLAVSVHKTGLFSVPVVMGFFKAFAGGPNNCWEIISTVVRQSRSWRTLILNLAVLPKAFYLSTFVDPRETGHIHSGWGTTTATIAWALGRLTGIPWSMTLHRGDIVDDNMLRVKTDEAALVRCISVGARGLLESIIGEVDRNKVRIMHLGAHYDSAHISPDRGEGKFIVVTAANLLPVKGLEYLIDACSLLKARGDVEFECRIYGEGPLRTTLEAKIRDMDLTQCVLLEGAIPHDALLALYRSGQIGAFILPSINTDDGQHEGIPVSLMEAMSWGIPVIATDTGAISELVSAGAGALVRERDPEMLAKEMRRMISDSQYRRSLSIEGRLVIASGFDLRSNVETLVRTLGEVSAGRCIK